LWAGTKQRWIDTFVDDLGLPARRLLDELRVPLRRDQQRVVLAQRIARLGQVGVFENAARNVLVAVGVRSQKTVPQSVDDRCFEVSLAVVLDLGTTEKAVRIIDRLAGACYAERIAQTQGFACYRLAHQRPDVAIIRPMAKEVQTQNSPAEVV